MSNEEHKHQVKPLTRDLLSASVCHHDWKKYLVHAIQEFSPLVHKSLSNGLNNVHPSFTTLPTFERFVVVGRKAGGNFSNLTAEDMNTPSFHAPSQPNRVLWDSEDEVCFYKHVRENEFRGKAGEYAYQGKVRAANDYATRFQHDYQVVFARIIASISPELLRKMKVPVTIWDTIVATNNVMELLALAAKVHSGHGNHVQVILFIRLLKLTMANCGQDFAMYSKEYNDLVTQIHEAYTDPVLFIDAMFTAIYVIGLNSADSHVIKEFNAKLFQSNVAWPSPSDIQERLSVALNTFDGITAATASGVISSNVAKQNVDKDYQGCCYNCGSDQHISSGCPEPVKTCTKCKKKHIDFMCKVVQQAAEKRNKYRMRNRNKSAPVKAPVEPSFAATLKNKKLINSNFVDDNEDTDSQFEQLDNMEMMDNFDAFAAKHSDINENVDEYNEGEIPIDVDRLNLSAFTTRINVMPVSVSANDTVSSAPSANEAVSDGMYANAVPDVTTVNSIDDDEISVWTDISDGSQYVYKPTLIMDGDQVKVSFVQPRAYFDMDGNIDNSLMIEKLYIYEAEELSDASSFIDHAINSNDVSQTDSMNDSDIYMWIGGVRTKLEPSLYTNDSSSMPSLVASLDSVSVSSADELEQFDDDFYENVILDTNVTNTNNAVYDMKSLAGVIIYETDSISDTDLALPNHLCLSMDFSYKESAIMAHIDTGSKANLVHDRHISSKSFQNVRPCHGVTVTGIDGSAPPKPASHVGMHRILGRVYFGDWATNVIGVPEILQRGMNLNCTKDEMVIVKTSNNSVIYRGKKNSSGLYSCDITIDDNIKDAFDRSITTLSSDMISPGINVNLPMNATEIERAKAVRELHSKIGHPSDQVFKDCLTSNAYVGIDLTPKDVDNAHKLFGKCHACISAKQREPVHAESQSFQTDKVGAVLYADLIACECTCLQGYKQMLVVVDYYSGNKTVTGMIDKSTKSITDALNTLVAYYYSHNHIVERVVFDHEANFVALINKIPKIICSYTPSGSHNRRAERAIQELKQRIRCILEDLPYEIDPRLQVLLWQNAAISSNLLTNERTPGRTPHFLVTGRRPFIPAFKFGQCVVVLNKSTSKRTSEYCVFIRNDYEGDHIVFNPSTGNVLSRNIIEGSDVYPAEWKWKKRTLMLSAIPNTDIPDPKFMQQPIESVNNEVTTPNDSQSSRIPGQNNGIYPTGIANPQVSPNVTSIIPINPQAAPTISSITPPTTKQNVTLYPSISRFIPVASDQSITRVVQPNISHTQPVMAAPTAAAPIVRSVVDTIPITKTKAAPLVSNELRRSSRSNIGIPYTSKGTYAATFSRHAKLSKLKRWKLQNADRIAPKILSFRISVRQALRDNDPVKVTAAKRAIHDEVEQLINMKTMTPVLRAIIPQNHRKFIIPSFIFLKEKMKADGAFDKLKARLVAGGNFVDTSLAGDISAYVVTPVTVMAMLNIAASKNLNIMTGDVTGAFLIPSLSTDDPTEIVYVVIDKDTSNIVEQIVPEWKRYRNPEGTFTMLLNKALYGLPVSAKKWMTHLNESLSKLGFHVISADKCCFIRGENDAQVIIASHVDDLLIIGKPPALTKFKREIESVYNINIQEGKKHSYLGMDIQQCPATYKVSISQSGYRQEVVNRFGDLVSQYKESAKVPCTQEIVDPPPSTLLNDRIPFLSIVYSIMFLARFTRPDLAFATAMLSTRSNAPTRADMKNAVKLLKYIATTPDIAIVYLPVPVKPTIFADASHGIHTNGRGHGCILMNLGSGMIYIRSYKLKLVTLSSTESEWTVLCEATQLAYWVKDLLANLGIIVGPVRICQDNTSAIWLTENGPSFARTKHLLIKRNYSKEGILTNTTTIVFTPGESMQADMGTKPLTSRLLKKLMRDCGLKVAATIGGVFKLLDINVPTAKVHERLENVPQRELQPNKYPHQVIRSTQNKARTSNESKR